MDFSWWALQVQGPDCGPKFLWENQALKPDAMCKYHFSLGDSRTENPRVGGSIPPVAIL